MLSWFIRRISVFLILISLLMILWELRLERNTQESVIRYFHTELNAQFQTRIQEIRAESENYLKDPSYTLNTGEDSYLFRVYRNDSLLYYNQGSAFPPLSKIKSWMKNPEVYVYQHGNATYAVLSVGADSLVGLALLPLKIVYPIRNQYLKSYVFMGDAERWPWEEMGIQPVRLQVETDAATGAIIQLSYPFNSAHQILSPARKRALPWILVFVLSLFFFAGKILFRYYRPAWKPAIVAICFLFLFRFILLLTGFPGNWVNIDLFSPRILAINEWNPSPADVFLNIFTLVFSAGLLLQVLPYRKWTPGSTMAGFLLLLCGLPAGMFYFRLFEEMAGNSQIQLNPENFFSFQLTEWVFYATSVLALCFTWMLFYSIGSWYRILPEHKNSRLIFPIFGLAFLLMGLLFITPDQPFLWVSYCGLVFLSYLQGYQSGYRGRIRLGFLDWVFILLAMAWVTEASSAVSYRAKQDLRLIRMSSRFSESRDPVAEYLFDVTVSRIQTDKELFRKPGRPGEVNRSLSRILLDDYILPEFKGYAPRLFLYNQYGLRMDESMEFTSLINPFRPDPRQEVQGFKQPGKNLYLVPYDADELIEKVYVGRFDFFLPLYGKIIAVLELIPKSGSSTQIYPRLLLDEDIPLQSLPEGFSFAVYLNKRLIRKAGPDEFPFKWNRLDTTFSIMPFAEQGEIRLIKKMSQDKILVLQTHSRSLVDRLISTSVLFFYFAFLMIGIRLPFALSELSRIRMRLRNLLFVQKIRLLLIGFSLIPFLGILFVFRPYIQLSFEADMQDKIQNELSQITDAITEESRVWLRDPGERSGEELRDILVRARELYGTDMNLFSAEGELIATTQPRVFELGLASRHIPYAAFTDLKNFYAIRTLQEEKIGDLRYWSAYQQISGADKAPLAYLNIPYLAQQEVLDARIRNFVSTLIQLYLIVLVILGVLSVAFSRFLTRPLTLLKARMDKIKLGQEYESIQVESGDEIGAIIKSYNRMLIQLKESEEMLKRTQRESAWKEMARQVAHEIKNPLTPMKLSIQHLIRAWNNQDPTLPDIFGRVSKSLLIQIDSLSNIATAFSSFASLPRPNIEVLNLTEILEDAVLLYQNAEEAEVILDPVQEEIKILADKDQLSRVFQNLIKNALQSIIHMPGEVRLRVETEPEIVRIYISDTGSGIPPEIQDKVFQPNFSTKNSGMGLGLAMVKRMLESISGRIRFETVPEKGTVFIVEIPLALEHIR